MYHDFPHRLFRHFLGREGVILLETSKYDASNHHSYLFFDPVTSLRIYSVDEVPQLMDHIDHHLRDGRWVAGYFGYECGYHFENIAPLRPSNTPLASFGVYAAPFIFNHLTGSFENHPASPAGTATDWSPPQAPRDLHMDISPEAHAEAIRTIKNYLRAGDTYQINFTAKYRFAFDGDPVGLYEELRMKQRVPYGAFIHDSGRRILCHSPELFFTMQDGSIRTKPMKGTVKRGRTLEEDGLLQEWLRTDEKSRAENVMIVDLLRNDLGRICEVGSVQVPELFAVERYDTLHQMTSTVTGKLRPGVSRYELFRSIFPCGSVTGAPKIRSMQIIHELESGNRGVYTGAIGYFSPDGRATFNVAIRTLVLDGNAGEMGVGSGIVADSVADQEYEECRLKAQFLTTPPVQFEILESLLWDDGFAFLEEHLMRISRSATYFDYACNINDLREKLLLLGKSFDQGKKYKVRLTLGRSGTSSVEFCPVDRDPGTSLHLVAISDVRTSSQDVFLYHKTTNRLLYDETHEKATRNGFAEILFLNENDEVTEGAISNIFIKNGKTLFTPPVRCGLLPGIYRQHMIGTQADVLEKVLTVNDLRKADALFVCNSVRGMRQVRLVETDDYVSNSSS